MARVDVLTKEYPPAIYGGAGVHVTELARVLREHVEVAVRCFGDPRDETGVVGYPEDAGLARANATLSTLGVDLRMAADSAGAAVLHSHTWYANMAGHLGGLLHGVPHVVTAHSLEPLRPWKAEQLGGGYAVSSFCERTAFLGAQAVIAVSGGMRADILRSYPDIDPDRVHVVHNGIDTSGWVRDTSPAAAETVRGLGVDPDRPLVVFVGRITRQKGLPYLLRAVELLPADTQVVLCAGAPDTPEIMAEVSDGVRRLQTRREGIVWIDRVLPRTELCRLLSHATAFVCPSVYEPLGIVNLEAMACGAAVVGTATGGIPEVVVPGETGWLVPIDQVDDGTGTPVDPERYVQDLAAALTDAVSDRDRARRYGEAGLVRAREHFSWEQIAAQTLDVYRSAGADLG
jgi:starch synthase